MICLSVRKQWILVTALAVVFFIGNVILLSKFSESFQKFLITSKLPDNESRPDEVSNDGQGKQPRASIGLSALTGKGRSKAVTKSELNGKTYPVPNKKLVTYSNKGDANLKVHSKAQNNFRIALLVISCNRPSVGRCLDQLLKYKPKNPNIPIFVSQDCGDGATARVIQSYGKQVKHLKQPQLGNVEDVPPHLQHFMGYYKISRHYKWALSQVFTVSGIDSVIIVEDDLDIAPDFFDYFLATRPLLDRDPTLWCVSGWNDNGKEGYVMDNSNLFRTDFFPGLGWMITKKVWEELKPKWPKGFWDDWMRNPKQRKDRACISPEISRTKTFGRVGVSMGQFFDQYLKFIKLNTEPYPFLKHDLSYLVKSKYDDNFLRTVYNSPEVRQVDVLQGNIHIGPARVMYKNNLEFELFARQLGIMFDLKSGVPRMAYRGIVTVVRNKVRIYIAPPSNWSGYKENPAR